MFKNLINSKWVLGMALVVGLAVAQSPVRVVDRSSNEIVIGAAGVRYESGMTTLTTSTTTLTTSTTRVQFIHCANTTAGAVSFTMTDNQASPKTYFAAVSIPANGVMTANYGTTGLPFASGIKWSAGANSSINCYVVGVQ